MMIEYGSTAHFVIYYDSALTGQPSGPACSQAVLDYCEYDLKRLSMLFGNIMPPTSSFPIQINMVPGTGGANNNLTNVINCFCYSNTDPVGLPALVVAEEAEIFMSLQGKGWNPGWSNGEALSRITAQILYPNRAWLFCTGNWWLSGDPSSPHPARSNWVDNVLHTDKDYVTIGCGSLLLNYLAYQLNLRWPDITGAGAPSTSTLAETAGILGVSNAWQSFSSLINTYLPPGSSLPPRPTGPGQTPEPTDDPYPLGPAPTQVPSLYMRHNLADDGSSHTGSLSDSPDIILKNNPVANPQATYSTSASIASDTESDPHLITGQANYVYLRVWNRGVDAANVFATVYWSPPATLVSPNLWNLIGSAYYPDVPAGSVVKISVPGVTWPADRLPGFGHDCFVATVGNSSASAPNPTSFSTFNDFVNYIYANNNITWRNFNVGIIPAAYHLPIPIPKHFGEYLPLHFLIVGAWDSPRAFELETVTDLPKGSRAAIQVPHWIGRGLRPVPTEMEEFEDIETDPENRSRLRVTIPIHEHRSLGRIELAAGTVAASHMLVHIPAKPHKRPHRVVIRQLYEKREVGRITWMLLPEKHSYREFIVSETFSLTISG